jgi:hypothetical protein
LKATGNRELETKMKSLKYEICDGNDGSETNTLSRILKLLQCEIDTICIDQAEYDKIKADYEKKLVEERKYQLKAQTQ